MRYRDYTTEDFVLDESFRNWILSRNFRDDVFWREWIEAHPGMRPVLEEARDIILGLQTEEVKVSQEEIDSQFEEVSQFFDHQMAPESTGVSWKFIGRIAATLLILVAAGIGVLYQFDEEKSRQLADNIQQVASRQQSERDNVSSKGTGSKAEENSSGNQQETGNEEQPTRKQATENKIADAGNTNGEKPEQSTPAASNKQKDQTMQYTTAGGEQQKITLPDGSEVYLNENSSLAFAKNWKAGVERKVRLEGEAYFKVEEKLYEGSKTKFTVATNDVKVEVVGTEFTVKELVQETQVFLQSGKIMLDIPDLNETIAMRPNEMVQYNAASGDMQLSSGVNEDPFVSWVNSFDRLVEQAKNAQYMTASSNVDAQNNAGNGNNLSRVLQSGNQNTAYIEQIGENLKSAQVQVGKDNRAEVRIEGGRNERDDLNWSTGQAQVGEDNVSIFNIIDSYNSNMFSGQAGQGNEVGITSKGRNNTGITLQLGKDNDIVIRQDGNRNEAIVLQKGDGGSFGMDDLKSLQQELKGRYNNVVIDQRGYNNKARTVQQGRNNTANINQNER
jgi:hypothetical protein